MEFEKLVRKFIEECRARGVGEMTLAHRESFLLKFGVWWRSNFPRGHLHSINGEIIADFLKSDAAFKSKATISSRMSHLRCFGDFLNREGIWEKNFVRWLRGPRLILGSHSTKALSREEIEKVIAAAMTANSTLLKHTWAAIVMCSFTLGLRRGELLGLDFKDWDAKTRTLRVKSTKSGKERYLPTPDSLAEVFESYVLARHRLLMKKARLEENAFFVNRNGERISKHSCSVGLQKIAIKAGVENFHMHRLRHTCATELVANGVSLPVVKSILGHSSFTTTSRYVQVSGPERKKAVELHPINNMLEAFSCPL